MAVELNYQSDKLPARIQKFYDILCEHQDNISPVINEDTFLLECELDEIILTFEGIFQDVIFK